VQAVQADQTATQDLVRAVVAVVILEKQSLYCLMI
jgi:hypothetical protein